MILPGAIGFFFLQKDIGYPANALNESGSGLFSIEE